LTSVPAIDSCLEDSGTHWGARVDGTCPCCRLSLLDTVADLQPGVIALDCGTSFPLYVWIKGIANSLTRTFSITTCTV